MTEVEENMTSSANSSFYKKTKEEQEEAIRDMKTVLTTPSIPIDKRYRALFTLRSITHPLVVDALASALKDPSALLKHEVAYCFGQMGDQNAFTILCDILKNTNEHPMVRHEAAEAIGALENPEALKILGDFVNDSAREVAETCQLAVQRVDWYAKNKPEDKNSIYLSVDPAPPLPSAPVAELKAKFLDQTATIFDRYRALFALRDKNNQEGVLALCEGLNDSSSLLKHEVAFVLGQIQHPCSVASLTKALEDSHESPMVRHEAAEALGAIAAKDAIPLLEKYSKDPEPIVAESCVVALDVADYFNNDQEFQYADGFKIFLEKKQEEVKKPVA
eukprot:TRINITY_DN748_c0_g1_i1.p1 TRINITY_DN748_c0_g1~~TRINITY_DN748_c0_g1_i1.p1  ORF type:complete len:333 (-),score=121.27 TRINITY_DN748_c0_g1_i1:122-1120(-)